ncbi:hypothetical protein [Parasphingopyxis sp.]|uniref:hypothetical protein n=1 Tax=Parasphingopyxis sp. TaxID=1920299 RepID=UPI003F9F371D
MDDQAGRHRLIRLSGPISGRSALPDLVSGAAAFFATHNRLFALAAKDSMPYHDPAFSGILS